MSSVTITRRKNGWAVSIDGNNLLGSREQFVFEDRPVHETLSISVDDLPPWFVEITRDTTGCKKGD
jgi:hypothetical protein